MNLPPASGSPADALAAAARDWSGRAIVVARRGIKTFGGRGESVQAVVMALAASGLSAKPGGATRAIAIDGAVTTNPGGVAPPAPHGALLGRRVARGLNAAGGRANPGRPDRAARQLARARQSGANDPTGRR